MIGDPGKQVEAYLGIPYAAPPVGDLRWRPPQPAASWLGIRACTYFTKLAPQAKYSESVKSEDCLFLNVLTPAKRTSDKLPVMVWMHGGGFHSGSNNGPMNALPRLPQNGIVEVSVNTRLGVFGLLAHPILDKESTNGVSGNYLFLDLIASLQWVQRNIAAFGGDPGNVTIFGCSGGGAKVATLMASPLAKGLFQRVISESGSSVTTLGYHVAKPLKDLEVIGQKFFKDLGVDRETDPLKAARALPWQKILEIATPPTDPDGYYLSTIAVDGWFLQDTPEKVFQSGKMNAVPLITLVSPGEMTGIGRDQLPELPSGYVTMLNGLNKAGVKGYASLFNRVPSKWKQEGLSVAIHGMEIPYVFGDWDNTINVWSGLYEDINLSPNGRPIVPPIVRSKDPGLTEEDRKLSETMMAMWTQFAKTGDPNIPGLVTWPAYQASTDQYLYIVDPLEVKSGFSSLPKMK